MSRNHYIRKGPIADTVPYDDENCEDCSIGDTVQEALDYLKDRNGYCSLAFVRGAPCPDAPNGYVNLEAGFLTDQNFCWIKKVDC